MLGTVYNCRHLLFYTMSTKRRLRGGGVEPMSRKNWVNIVHFNRKIMNLMLKSPPLNFVEIYISSMIKITPNFGRFFRVFFFKAPHCSVSLVPPEGVRKEFARGAQGIYIP